MDQPEKTEEEIRLCEEDDRRMEVNRSLTGNTEERNLSRSMNPPPDLRERKHGDSGKASEPASVRRNQSNDRLLDFKEEQPSPCKRDQMIPETLVGSWTETLKRQLPAATSVGVFTTACLLLLLLLLLPLIMIPETLVGSWMETLQGQLPAETSVGWFTAACLMVLLPLVMILRRRRPTLSKSLTGNTAERNRSRSMNPPPDLREGKHGDSGKASKPASMRRRRSLDSLINFKEEQPSPCKRDELIPETLVGSWTETLKRQLRAATSVGVFTTACLLLLPLIIILRRSS